MPKLETESTDVRIQKALNKLIKEIGEDLFTDDFKRSPAYKTKENKLDTLGIIISKYCEYNGEEIKAVALSAFEDSNFGHVEIDLH